MSGANLWLSDAPFEEDFEDGPAPPASPSSNAVQELECLWHLSLEERIEDEGTCAAPVPEQYDPLHSEISRDLIDRVLVFWDVSLPTI